jgi:hypothetical protein
MSRAKWACLMLSLFPLLGMGDSQKSKKVSTVPDFEVEGMSFTECECTAYACPCRRNGHPTHGGCRAADFTYIKRGHFDVVKLDGLKAVEVGNLLDKNTERQYSTFYFNENTTPDQREAFLKMYSYIIGKWDETSGTTVSAARVKVVPIEFRESPDRTVYTLTIPGILEEKAVLKRDKDGKPLTTVPAMDLWGNKISYADNVVFKYHDKDLGREWDLSGRQSNVKEFQLRKADFDQKRMLAQHGDMSGDWTEKQKQLIRAMGMKPE